MMKNALLLPLVAVMVTTLAAARVVTITATKGSNSAFFIIIVS